MAIIDLDEIKAQLRIDDSDNDDVLLKKIDAAQGHLERLLGFKLDETAYPDTDDADFPETVPAPLRECVCQLAAHWYENREAVTMDATAQLLPIGVNDVVNEFRNWSWAV